ncbi:MFS transporter [Actinoallomurus oryzae]|jgi:DHA1 family inner membrane transport protein|uniref:MFS transporter n=1 Tax=Actinoallomurus oryzae TaxID=502180 RepID=A0ABP8QI10_9ACTN
MTDSVTGDRWLPHVSVLAVGAFVVGTDAFVIAGLLPDISRSLSVSVAAAGQLVSVFSIAYAVLSPVLAALTGGWSRRTVLVAALLVFAAGNVVTALAPGYPLVLAARVLAAAGAAMFTPNAGATAATVAGERRRGQAIAVVTVGLTSSLVVGAPLGTAIGDAWGWRATLWFVTALTVVVTPIIALRLPHIRLAGAAGLRQRFAPLADAGVVRVLAGTLLAFIGIYLPYTYIGAVFAPALDGDGDRVALLLFAFGVTGTAGNLVAGRLADRYGPRRVVITATLSLAVVFLVMPLVSGVFAAVVPVVALSGLASWSVTAPQQHRTIALSPAGAGPLAVSLNAAVLYLAISLSGLIGAVGLKSGGAAALPVIAAVFVLAAAILTWLSGPAERRATAAVTRKTAGTVRERSREPDQGVR